MSICSFEVLLRITRYLNNFIWNVDLIWIFNDDFSTIPHIFSYFLTRRTIWTTDQPIGEEHRDQLRNETQLCYKIFNILEGNSKYRIFITIRFLHPMTIEDTFIQGVHFKTANSNISKCDDLRENRKKMSVAIFVKIVNTSLENCNENAVCNMLPKKLLVLLFKSMFSDEVVNLPADQMEWCLTKILDQGNKFLYKNYFVLFHNLPTGATYLKILIGNM